jgi:hypothetical protein
MKASNAFLTTTGTDRRRLLSQACCTLAQVHGEQLLPKEQLARAKAAVTADPTYFNCHCHLSQDYQQIRE